ncbi:MAG: hypothetical protein OXF89_18605 [Rhodospirillaceae bacterium]|nr:hypothetical protein [Rhodospirillaceae bacterium]
MTRQRLSKTNFTAGEIAPELLGRGDLTAFDNGAALLRNVFILPTGGVTRRPGLRFVGRLQTAIERVADGIAATAPNGGEAARAHDGDGATRLETGTPIGTTDPYVVVRFDLGRPRPIRFADAADIALSRGAASGEFRIQHSADDGAWSDFGPAFGVTGRAESVRRSDPSQHPVAARYWRIARIGATDLAAATVSLSGFHLWTDSGRASPGRLIAFAFNTEQTYLLALTGRNLAVYAGDVRIADLPTPWAAERIGQVVWAQSADTLLMTHPDAPPVAVTRNTIGSGPAAVEDWRVGPWRFLEEDSTDEDDEPVGTALRQPYRKFADPEIALTPSRTGRDAQIVLTASEPVFDDGHVGQRLRLAGRQVLVKTVESAYRATAVNKEALLSGAATRDWEEPAFSARRGWPATVAFHQDRLVIGGSRDLPNRIWLSKSGDLFNFDLGEGLDDDGIEFAILSDQVNAIRAVFSGRHLQVLTSGAEWMVTGDPLTPGNIQLNRQTRIGSPVDRQVPPRDVDGATLFAARNGRELREFLFADVEQAYRANDLALLARHLVDAPVDQDYDPLNRLLHIVMADGSLATVTVYRAERVTGWSRQETDGKFRAIAVVDRTVFAIVERAGGRYIERFDAALATDSALTGADGTDGAGRAVWSGLGHLEGRTVAVLADNAVRQPLPVDGGAIALDRPAGVIEAGLPFASRIRALPPVAQTPRGASHGSPVRLVEAVFRLLDTRMLRIDTGAGPRTVPFRTLGRAGLLDAAPPAFTGDVAIRALGWLKGAAPPWSLEQSDPLPFTILAVSTELKVGD